MRVITRKGSNRVAREAFEIARTRERKKVTAAHKEPVYRLACGMFAEECRKVAREYPDVTFEEVMIDTISMKLVMAPQQYDVVVTTNQFGDILTDIGAGLGRRAWAGARALRRRAPGDGAGDPRLGARHRRPQHRQSLRHDHVGADAAGIGSAASTANRKRPPPPASCRRRSTRSITEAKHLTSDLGGKASTQEMGDAIAAAVLQ